MTDQIKKISGEERKKRDKLLRLCTHEALHDTCNFQGVFKEMNECNIKTALTELTFQFQHYDNRMHEKLDPLPQRTTAERIESLELVIQDLQEAADVQLNFVSECQAWPAAKVMNDTYFDHLTVSIKFFQSELERLTKI